MRKCEIVVGVADLLIIAFAVLRSHVANTTVGIGISGGADGPTAIYLYSSISYNVVFMLANGLLLLIPPRWKAIVILSVLLGFLHVLNILGRSIEAIDFYSGFGTQNTIFLTLLARDLFVSIINIPLLLRRGVKQWWKKKAPLPPIEP